MSTALDYETDSNEESDSASNFDSEFQYWDPVSDTYKDKRKNKSVPDEIEARIGMALDYETDPNEESDSAASSDLNYEYWDPVSDTYKVKRRIETVADDTRLEEVPNLNSKIGGLSLILIKMMRLGHSWQERIQQRILTPTLKGQLD